MNASVFNEKVGPAPHIAIDHSGDGPLLLFLHGIGGNRSNWRDQIEHFAPRFHACAMDVRGWGDSDDYEGPYHFDDVVEDIARVLAHLGAARAHVVGLSMGGLITQHLLLRRPDLVRSAVLVDTSSGPGDEHDERWVADFLRLRKAPLLAGKTPADIAPTVARSLLGPAADEAVYERLRASIAALHKDSYLKALDSVSAYKRQLDHARVGVPLHVMVGEHDALTPPGAARALAALKPGTAVDVVPAAGHLANLENPQAFNRLLGAFLDRIGASLPEAAAAPRAAELR